MIFIASAKPQGSRFDVDDDSSDDIAVIPTRGGNSQNNQLSQLLRGLGGPGGLGGLGGLGGQPTRQLGGFSGGQRRPSGGAAGGIIRLLLNLVGAELGLENLNSQLFDGVDEEVLLRNLIRTFTSIVGNVILR